MKADDAKNDGAMINRVYWSLRDRLDPSPTAARGLERMRRRWGCKRELLLREMLDDLEPGSTLFDIGAGVGLYSISLASRHQGLKSIAFEPNPGTRRRLTTSVALEALESRIAISPLALGDRVEQRPFFVSSQLGRSGLRAFNAKRGGAKVVSELTADCSTVDQVISSGQYPAPDALKIDVEGYEYEVILGAEQTIAEHRPSIYFESHAREGSQQSTSMILEHLARYGYVFEGDEASLSGHVRGPWSREPIEAVSSEATGSMQEVLAGPSLDNS